MHYRQDLNDLLAPTVEAEGFELYGVEFINQGKHSVLRLYIDHPEGITVDNCADVSRQVSAILDVEDPINGEYNLEVSSPGIERPLYTLQHFTKVVGSRVKINMQTAIDGRKVFIGTLEQVDGNNLMVQCDAEKITLPFTDVANARLIVNV